MTQSTDPILTAEDVRAGMRVIANDLTEAGGFTLTTIGHNEKYFLPAFLAHYRALGVSRFVIVDDVSDDGSLEYLTTQPDVMVIGSAHRYGDRIMPPGDKADGWGRDFRVNSVWRKYLLDEYGAGAWSLHVDLDEFIHLPPGLTFPALARRLDPIAGEVVWAVMLEVYPETIADMMAAKDDTGLDLGRAWYFDGRAHLRPEGKGKPRMDYAGFMARILARHGLIRPPNVRRWIKWHLTGEPFPYNSLQKPALLYWDRENVFFSSHKTDKPGQHDMLLPMLHFKFTGALYGKLEFALQSGAYFDGSRKYKLIETLLAGMVRRKARLAGRHSVRFTSYEDLERTGNAMGLR